VGQLIQGVVHEHQAAFPRHRIDVWQTGNLMGEWDADRLAQAASNLIGNALQHGDGETVDVQLDGTQEDAIVFSVANAGNIAPDLLPHIFDPFYGGQQQTCRTGGLGLGLYIVQQIVYAHQGSVEVRSEKENHTLFQVNVPRKPAI
jgi:two-component system sensor histidine kinase/response regulator